MTDDEFDRALWSPPLDDDQDLDRINWMAARGARRGALVGVLVAALAKAGALDNSGTAAHESIRVTTK